MAASFPGVHLKLDRIEEKRKEGGGKRSRRKGRRERFRSTLVKILPLFDLTSTEKGMEGSGKRTKRRGSLHGRIPTSVCRRTIEKYLRTASRGRGSINFFIPAVWKIGFYSK